MKNVLKKGLSLGLALVLISSLLPIGTLVNASSADERVTYTSVIGPGGWLNGNVVRYDAGIYASNGDGSKVSPAADGNTTLGENMRAVKWQIGTANGGSAIKINSASDDKKLRKIVVPNWAEKAYFEFDIYTTSAFKPAKLHLGGWTEDGKWPNLTYEKFSELSANTWHTIKLSLDELAISTGYNWTQVVRIDNIRICLPSTISAAFDVYIKNMRFSYDPSITISATRDGNDMDLTWTSDVAATSYDVYRNGDLVADNITEASYEDTVINDGDCVTYKIEAYIGEKKVVENEKTVVVHPLNQIVSLDIIDANGSYSSTLSKGNSGLKYISGNYAKCTPVKNTSGIPDGAVQYQVAAKDKDDTNNKVEKLVYEFNGNIQNFRKDAYIAMLLYIEADANDTINKPIRLFLTENTTWYKYQPKDFSDLAVNQWHYIKVPISELKNLKTGKTCTGENIYDLQIQFTNPTEATSAYKLYVKDLRIAYDCTISADKLTPSVGETVTFTTDSTQGFKFIVAVYDTDRKLISVEFVNGATKEYTVKEGDKYIKAMLWTDMTKLIPVASAVEVTVQ